MGEKMEKASLKKRKSGNPKGIPKYLATEDFQTMRYMKDLAESALAKLSVTLAV